ncbi:MULTISPECIES: phosphate signaling complex PhoU family protein [unclassified Carboxylicivirga]|uniref:phosphate signaling complex PhoU family protein n=1 Tax=Carboxylicivirga TaxID=1628153 RepID=UPI003D330BFC
MLQKDKALKKIDKDFKSYADLMMQQLTALERLVQTGYEKFDEEIKQIEATEQKLDIYEVQISEKIINAIVLHHPVASELRNLMACYRIVINMERIGDLVKDVARFIQKIEDSKLYGDLSDFIFNMITASNSMVEKSLLSFINKDREAALWTIKNDEVIDEIYKKMLKKGIKKTSLQDEAREMLVNLINFKSIISKIERIGDHACHIAEASIFAQDGRDIRHQNMME